MPERLNNKIGEKLVKKTLNNLQEYVNEIEMAYAKRDAYRYIENDQIVNKTYQTFASDIFAVASWLCKRGWESKHIAIIGSSSYAWVVTFLGIACSGNVVIPIDKMLPEEEILNLLKMGDVDVVFLSSEFAHLIEKIGQEDKHVQEVINFADAKYEQILATEPVPLPVIDPDAMADIFGLTV